MGGALTGSFGRCEIGTEVVTIGRAPTNKVTISDGQVSGRHAEVRPDGAGYVLVDVGSTNGTLLNGTKIPPQTPQPLGNGDVVTIGSFKITVELAAGALPATIRAAPPNEGAYAPTERVGAPPAGGAGGAAYAGTSYVPPPPPPPDLPPLVPGGPGLPPAPPYPDSFGQYGGNPGGAAPYYPDPYASAAPPPAYTPPGPAYASPYAGPPGVGLGAPGGTTTNNRKPLLIGGGILAAVIIIVGIVGIIGYVNAHSSSGVANTYYTNIQNQKYGDAYQMLTGTLQSGLDQQARQLNLSNGQELFTRLFACWDTEYGNVTAFTVKELSNDDSNAIERVDVTRSQAGNYTDQVKMQKVGGDWKVADFQLLECK